MSATAAAQPTETPMIHVEVVALRDVHGLSTGRAMVRGFLGRYGVDWVAPRRDSFVEALSDIAELELEGLHSWRIRIEFGGATREFRVNAATATAAAERAHQLWGNDDRPLTVEHLGFIARVSIHPDASQTAPADIFPSGAGAASGTVPNPVPDAPFTGRWWSSERARWVDASEGAS